MLSINQLQELPLEKLKALDHSMEMFLCAETTGEGWEPSFKKDPKEFNKLITETVSFKSSIMGYFRRQYENRYNLVNQAVVRWDEMDDYLYAEQWYKDQEELTTILEEHIANGFDLGTVALAVGLGLVGFDFGSQEYQRQITKQAEKSAQTITNTTQRRTKRAIEAALRLKEDRTTFDARLKSVFVNPYRGRFIAKEEAIDAYMLGKEGLALNEGLDYKQAESSQARDKLCAVHGEIRKINEVFSNGFLRPKYHFGCRCNVRYFRK